jgi:hypothetical protein
VSTLDALNTAWDKHTAALAGRDVTAQVRARERLYEAAQAHAAASRPLASVTRYYIAVHDDPDRDPAAVWEASQELDGVRRAAAILAGAWPGTLPVVSTGG